ncbi:MAG: DUF4234 domain-containing protein [Ruminococcaceae bacterium]|nr:DUF4234 domain-containing protein [Oscillospiraceae bacterium]
MTPIKENRSFIKFIILNTLTLGIYSLFFFSDLVDDVNTLCEDDGYESPGIFSLIFFSLLTFGIYAIFYWYRVADMLDRAIKREGLPYEISGSFVAVCMVLSYFSFTIGQYVAIYKIINATNALAEEYNRDLAKYKIKF